MGRASLSAAVLLALCSGAAAGDCTDYYDETSCQQDADCAWSMGECSEVIPAEFLPESILCDPRQATEAECDLVEGCVWVVSACMIDGDALSRKIESLPSPCPGTTPDTCPYVATEGVDTATVCVWVRNTCVELDLELDVAGAPTGPCTGLDQTQCQTPQEGFDCVWAASTCIGIIVPEEVLYPTDPPNSGGQGPEFIGGVGGEGGEGGEGGFGEGGVNPIGEGGEGEGGFGPQ